MFNPDNIRDQVFTEYSKLIDLLKKKGPTQEKYTELKIILQFFFQNKDSMNSDELKLLKNVILMTDDILNKAVPNRKKYKEEKEECTTLYISIKDKNLPK